MYRLPQQSVTKRVAVFLSRRVTLSNARPDRQEATIVVLYKPSVHDSIAQYKLTPATPARHVAM